MRRRYSPIPFSQARTSPSLTPEEKRRPCRQSPVPAISASSAPLCPMPELDEVAAFRTRAPGGHGAVCEAIRWLLREQGKLDAALERYRR